MLELKRQQMAAQALEDRMRSAEEERRELEEAQRRADEARRQAEEAAYLEKEERERKVFYELSIDINFVFVLLPVH